MHHFIISDMDRNLFILHGRSFQALSAGSEKNTPSNSRPKFRIWRINNYLITVLNGTADEKCMWNYA